MLTHARLKENIDDGGRPNPGLADAGRLKDGPLVDRVVIKNFTYQQGDLSLNGRQGLPPVVKQGQQLTFVNEDPTNVIFHTITACRQPCRETPGHQVPARERRRLRLRRARLRPAGFTAAANTDTYRTPANLQPGTYTYFCRIHPFMRGAFRVQKS